MDVKPRQLVIWNYDLPRGWNEPVRVLAVVTRILPKRVEVQVYSERTQEFMLRRVAVNKLTPPTRNDIHLARNKGFEFEEMF